MIDYLSKIRLSEKFFLLLLFFLSLLFSVSSLQKPMITEPDGYNRSNLAKTNLEKKIWFDARQEAWLPLHFTILEFSLLIHNNVFLSPRIITLLISSSGLIIIYFYSFQITHSKKVSLITSFFYTFLPIRSLLSTQTLSEPIFIVFLLISLAYLFSKKPNYFIFLIFLNLCHGIRYESWAVIPLLIAEIISKNTSWKIKILISILTAAFPIYWLISNNFLYHNPFFFFDAKKDTAQQLIIKEYGNLSLSFLTWEEKLAEILSVTGIAITIVGYIQSKKNQSIIQKIIPILLFSSLIIQMFLETMEWAPHRYLLIPVVLALPFSAIGIDHIFQKSKFIFLFCCLSLLLSFINISQQLPLKISPEYFNFEEQFFQMAAIIKEIKKKDHPNFQYFFNQSKRLYLDQQFSYFSGNYSINSIEKINSINWPDKTFFIIERNSQDNFNEISAKKILFAELPNFYLAKNY